MVEPQPSWRLKIARAEHHFEDLRQLVERYRDGHHYRAVGMPPPKKHPTHWRFVLQIAEPPDPQIAIVFGDFLFNVRSALDHIAVACAPRARKREAGFPLYQERPAGQDAARFERMTRGMPPDALAVIEYEQPYNVHNRTADVGPQSVEALYTLNALQDADKHRSLAAVASGITHPQVQISWAGEVMGILTPRYVAPGEQLVRYDEIGNRMPYSEVTVDVRGRPQVVVKISGGEDFELMDVAGGILGRVRDRVIPSLEPFART